MLNFSTTITFNLEYEFLMSEEVYSLKNLFQVIEKHEAYPGYHNNENSFGTLKFGNQQTAFR